MRAKGQLPSNHWDCQKVTIGTTPTLVILPFKDTNTVMIQAKFSNAGYIYFSSSSNLDSSGTDAGGELAAGMSATLPIGKDTIGTSLYLCASLADQVIFISSYNIGV